ncbi:MULTISPECIES: hypothetical protein [unclassified Bradyrhizobium]|uniref:DUF6894 family protein n=1 Tax=unclassified Bradyrhizobium TaxID=2631580 RepID=UPI00247B01DD|nr:MULTISPECIES: hypothetical protein [unclassified Bradyrhizobium]WGR91661.1 hypothetical protein MTX20_25210 [Bradyrhizobium sp. ISRA435]WGS01981.1 hypothetical protein MTX23_14690 [Bradyrhizobium sp. ISRA436]WGS08866.1 hypothetical protein MTX18_14680 [Bradyrhizobium sp. ISRA437]WGS15755.1 hypothetical protein MTX26_14680 [Bradyrhizobium sp. ISRA443]WGS23440.1 hypothetical protein MTX22_18535 [Bradyrhizobium sp. ISRA463]
MPRYFFDYRDATGVIRDDVGEDLPGVDVARELALVALGDAARDFTRQGREDRLTIEIRDGEHVVAGATVTVATSWWS